MAVLASLCLAPSETGVHEPVYKMFGHPAAGTIGNHYLRTRNKKFFFPLSTTEFEDFTAG